MELNSGASVSPGSQTRGSKRQLEAAEDEGGVRDWVKDEEEEAERQQQLRQQQRRGRCSSRELHWRELQVNQLVERHHKRRCWQWTELGYR